MPKLEFGSLEMTPMYNVSADNERRKEELDSPTRIITNDLHEFDVTMPEADEPTKLEEIPLTESDESTRHVKKSRIIGINKVQLTSGSAPRYMFIVKLDWDDRTVTFINRDHDDFFRYHCWVLDTFKREAGHGDDPRTIPMLPGKKWFRNDIRLAEERGPLIETYLNKLTKLKRICESKQAQAFFGRRPGDPKEDDPILQEAILECEDDGGTSWTRERPKLEVDPKLISTDGMEGSHENETFQPDPDDDINRTGDNTLGNNSFMDESRIETNNESKSEDSQDF